METVIQAENLGVWYRRGVREDFRSFVLDALHGRRRKTKAFYAVEGVDFSVSAGEVVGIIGANGAGKTTICSVIARVLRPDRGTVEIRGDVSALLSMGTGFNSELSGRENIMLNGLMLGFSRRDVRALTSEIVEFAGVGRFIDAPVKHYSSGMKSRLGFSIASMLNPEVLVLDEALGAGDAEFAERAQQRLSELVTGAKAVVVVTHNLGFVRNACDRAIWIDKGSVRADADAESVVQLYEESVPTRESRKILTEDYQAPTRVATGREVVRVRDLTIRFRLNRKPFNALEGVSFTVHAGEIIGVIGANGAGKTTLCRALSRIYRPDSGSVQLRHQVSALLSMATGFNRMLPARDNILLNGMMLGLSRKRMKDLVDPIVEFAGLEKHRERPVHHYSSGMKAKLAFSIAVAVDPELLILDEALGAGDLAFKQKAAEAMDRMIGKAEAVVVVSHSMPFVESVCTRAIWLDEGRVVYDGEPREAAARYQNQVRERKQG
ncbi:MAG: ABC transporter ATP-binding protein [Spirochaetota bacterium]